MRNPACYPDPHSPQGDFIMKNIALALALSLLISGTAFAHDFSKFSMDIPKDWHAMEENGVVAVTAPGNEAAISIAAEKMEKASIDVVAKAFSQKLEGTEPKADDKGVYSFSFTRDGVKSTCFCSLEDGEFLLITVTDPTGRHIAAIRNMLTTLKKR